MKQKYNLSYKVLSWGQFAVGIIFCISCMWAAFYLAITGFHHFYDVLNGPNITNIQLLREQANFVIGVFLLYAFSKGFKYWFDDYIIYNWNDMKKMRGKGK